MHHFWVKMQGTARRDPCQDRVRPLGVSLISAGDLHSPIADDRLARRHRRFRRASAHGTIRAMAEWIYFIHTPRDDFAESMTDEEVAVWGVHFERFQRLLDEGTMILVGPTLGRINTGIAIFEAPDEETARRIMDEDPVIAGGFARGELRPFRVSLMRGRD